MHLFFTSVLLAVCIAQCCSTDFIQEKTGASPDHQPLYPQFAVEPTNVVVLDGVPHSRSAVFTCLMTQPVALSSGINRSLRAGHNTAINWYYNGKQVDAITDKIRIPLANGSLYVSAAAAEHPKPILPLADVPLPNGKGYSCRASVAIDHKGKPVNMTLVSRVAHVVKNGGPSHMSAHVSSKPQRLQVHVGDVVVLVCGGPWSDAPASSNNNSLTLDAATVGDRFVWFRDDLPFPDESDADASRLAINILDNGRIVEFSALSRDDFGEYTCSRAAVTAEERRNVIVSRFIITQSTMPNPHEDFQPSVRFLVKPSERASIVKSSSSIPPTVILPCSAAATGGNPSDQIITSWLRDGVSIFHSDTNVTSSLDENLRYLRVGLGSLLISDAKSNDSGLYTCRITLSSGESTVFADANVMLSIIERPEVCYQDEREPLAGKARAVIAPLGGSVEIDCSVKNADQFFWFHNGEFLPSAEDSTQRHHVESRKQQSETRDHFYEYSHGSTIRCGKSLSLWALAESDAGAYQCFGVNAAGLTVSTVFLMVEQQSLNGTNDMNSMFATPAATMLQGDANTDKFKHPTNVRATAQSATAIKLAWDPPLLSEEAIISGYILLIHAVPSESPTATPDSPHHMRRLFAVNPEILLDRLTPDRRYEITVAVAFKTYTDSSIVVGAMSLPIVVSTGNYSPSENPVDETFHQFPQVLQPRNIRAELRNPTTVSIAWSSPDLSDQAPRSQTKSINRYRLYYRGGTAPLGIRNSQQDAYIDLPGHQTSHVLTSLQPNSPYTFYVRAGLSNDNEEATQVAFGPASRDVTIWTPSSAPSGSVQNLEATATGPSAVTLRWQPPPANVQNGLITGYKVVYQPRTPSSKMSAGRTALTDGITTMISLKDLAANTNYEFRVAAINVNGSGPLSDAAFAKTAEQQLTESATPGAPFAFTARAASPSQIILSWQPPSSASSVLVRGYYLSFGVGEPYRNQVMVDATKTEHVLTNLRPSSEYIISLRSYNNYGYGPEVFQAVRTPQLQSKSANGDEQTDDRPSKLDSSAPHNQHNQNQRNSPRPLSVPLGVKAFTLSDSAILVSWTDPNEIDYSNSHHQNNPKAHHHISYNIRYGPIATPTENLPTIVSAAMRWRIINSTLPSVRIHSLEPFVEYEFAVRIIRVDADNPSYQHTSDWSMSATNRTLGAPPSDPPRDVKVAEVSSSGSSSGRSASVRVSWQPPSKPNGVVTSYVIFYAVHSPNRPEREWQVIGVAGDRFSVLIRRLQPDTSYYFKVQAKNLLGYGPPSMPPVHIRTPTAKSVIRQDELDNKENGAYPHAPSSSDAHPPKQSVGQSDNVAEESMDWPFEFFGSKNANKDVHNPSLISFEATTANFRYRNAENVNQVDSTSAVKAQSNTLWLAVSAAVGALIVCGVVSVALFLCRKFYSPRTTASKLMPKSESMGMGRHSNLNNGKMPPSDATLQPSANADMWATRDHLEMRQQLMSSAELQSTAGGISVMNLSDENFMQSCNDANGSHRHRISQSAQDQSVVGAANRQPQVYHIDPYENETIIVGDANDHTRQTTSSILCSPNGGLIGTLRSYRQHQSSTANARLFNARTSASAISCQDSYPLLLNGYRHPSEHNEVDEFNANAAALSTGRLGGIIQYHHHHHQHGLQNQSRGSPASMIGSGMVNINDHQQQLMNSHRSQHIANSHHQTLPRLSIATMPSPAPPSMHRYEPLLTTTSNGDASSTHTFAFPPSAQTPDSGCDIENSLHHQLQQHRQRTSLSSSSYGGGGGSVSSSTTNNIANFGYHNRQAQQQLFNGDIATNSPSVASSSLSASTSNERPRLSSFQPAASSQSANATPTSSNNGNKTPFLHLSRVLPPTPGQTRPSTATMIATQQHCSDRTSSATLSSSSPANSSVNGAEPSKSGINIRLPPAPPELHLNMTTAEEDLAVVAEMNSLNGLLKDLKLDKIESNA